MISDDILHAQLGRTVDKTDFPTLGEKYEGKVRDNYTKAGKRIIIVSDRLSAFGKGSFFFIPSGSVAPPKLRRPAS